MFVTIEDFVGKYQISTGMYDTDKLQEYIDKYEKQYLIELFGAELYDEFISDLDVSNVPQSPNFLMLFNPFHKNLGMGQLIMSDGIQEMLKGFIYFEYVKDLANQMTPLGNVRPTGENSTSISSLGSMMYNRYNTAIKSYRAIQLYILTNFTQPVGQVVSAVVSFGGSSYPNTGFNVATSPSVTGSGLTINYIASSGVIDGFNVQDSGTNYVMNDFVNVLDGSNDAVLLITYAGKGNYRTFKGIQKQTAYWI
jgi:hypothetical protein